MKLIECMNMLEYQVIGFFAVMESCKVDNGRHLILGQVFESPSHEKSSVFLVLDIFPLALWQFLSIPVHVLSSFRNLLLWNTSVCFLVFWLPVDVISGEQRRG